MVKMERFGELIRIGLLKLAFLYFLFLFCPPPLAAQVMPLTNAHAHNDYWHFRPLIQAVNNGFMSVEADVSLISGRILVAHERIFARKRKSLWRKYLEPLYEKAKANDFKSVYPNGPKEFILYIDIKTGCPDLLDTLISQLKKVEPMLTVWENGVKKTGAVSVIVGPCSREEEWVNAPKRYFYFDSYLGGIGSKYGPDVIPRVSTNLRSVISWRGCGQIPADQKAKLDSLIAIAHADKRTIRFWAATNKPKVWKVLLDAGVDWVNVDRLRRFRKFMEKRRGYKIRK